MMTAPRDRRRFWRTVRGLAIPVLLWSLFVAALADTLRTQLHGVEEYDEAALREWVEESRVFRETLPEMVRAYLEAADPDHGQPQDVALLAEEVHVQLESLGNPTRLYQAQLPLFPAIYRMELEFRPTHGGPLPPIVWDSGITRARDTSQVRRLEHPLLGPNDTRAILHFEYQFHAFSKRQRDEQANNARLRWVGILAVIATALAFLWITLVQGQERERERQRLLAQQQIDQAQRRHEQAERELLEQRLEAARHESRAADAERQALELKSQLYASIGIMAGSYAHNIKNLLVRPNDLLRRCIDADGLSGDQNVMLREVRRTLGTVTERLQQILQTVKRDPSRSVLTRLDLNALARDIHRTWDDLAREKWKMSLTLEANPDPLWVEGDLSHLQQAVENLVFNARDATFEMRNRLRDQAHAGAGSQSAEQKRQALIAAAAWKGMVSMRTIRKDGSAVLEVRDNGIGMSEDVRRRCTETHFTTKRDNALYEGHGAGMGLGLSFVAVVLEHHHAKLEIESAPGEGALFRMSFPVDGTMTAIKNG